MRVLVTGGAGFIGSSVVDRLLDEGHVVHALDNFDPYYDPAQKRRHLERALLRDGFTLHEQDVRDADAVHRVFEGARIEGVVHLAARAGVRASVDDPLVYAEVNELGGVHILNECVARGGLPLVYASTSSVYGATKVIPFQEDDPAACPLSPYAASKRAGELMAHAFWHIHRQPTAILRFFTVYGPRGRPDMAFAKFTHAIENGGVITLHGHDTERDFTFIDDIVDGVTAALHWVVNGRGFGTFNLGRSDPVNIREVVAILGKALGKEPRTRMGELQPGESRVTAADVSLAAETFGYQPRVALAEGVRRWVEWLATDEAPPNLRR